MKILKIAFVMASALLSICASGGNLVDGKVTGSELRVHNGKHNWEYWHPALAWPQKTYGGDERLFYDEESILAIRNKVDSYGWASSAYETLRQRVVKPFKDTPMTKGIATGVLRLKEIALYYRISGDDTHLPELVRYLCRYYRLDEPDVPRYDKSAGVARTLWHEVMCFDLRLLPAYDLIKNHPSFAPYKAAMESRILESLDYLKYAVSRIRNDSNTTFWTVAGLACYGFYTGDQEAVDAAVNGKWGFKHVLGTFTDGGRFRPEGSMYQYLYVDTALYIIAELASRCGWPEDLYDWEHPVSGASLRKMALAMADLCQPDGNIITRGDHSEQADPGHGGWGVQSIALFGHPEYHRVSDKIELLYRVYRDPRLAWVISHDPGRRTRCDQYWGLSSLTDGVGEIGPVQAPSPGSEVLEGLGMAFLKSVEGPEYWGSGCLTATLCSGVRQLTHNHRDHFSVTLNAYGKNLLNDWFLYWDYLCPRKGRANMTPYSARSIAHNTVCVDFSEPGDAPVKYSAVEKTGRAKSVSLEGSVYDGVRQKRTILITPEYAVDVFALSSSSGHNYDYVLHSRGHSSYSGVGAWRQYPALNGEYGFGPIDTLSVSRPHPEWLLSPKMASVRADRIGITFYDSDGISLRTSLFCPGGRMKVIDTATPFYINLGGWDKPVPEGIPERNPMTVVRVEASCALFVAVHQPAKSDTPSLDVSLKGGTLRVRGEGIDDEYDLDYMK